MFSIMIQSLDQMEYFFLKRKRIVIAFLLLIVTYYLSYFNDDTVQYTLDLFLPEEHLREDGMPDVRENGMPDEKLVTLFTTFVDGAGIHNSKYRLMAQLNFLRMTTFECFEGKLNFIVFTESVQTKSFIAREYPLITVLPTPLRNNFTSPLLKDLFRMAMSTKDSFFFMFANADNMYDSSLLNTLSAVRRAWAVGLMRQKLIMFGQRNNVIVNEAVLNEDIFLDYFKLSVQFNDIAQDYFIVTRDSIEWDLYPEVLVGRRAYDNMLVDVSVRNELEAIDATGSIRLLHQSEGNTNHSAFDERNYFENNWNSRLAFFENEHQSTTCARYRTELLEFGDIIIYDKKYKKELETNRRPRDYFYKEHSRLLQQISLGDTTTADITIIVLTYNKPESLSRLLSSLLKIGNRGNTNAIDMVISVDRGHMGYFDLPTLIVANAFEWEFGRKKVVLKERHAGQLYQWLEAYGYTGNGSSFVLILEDSVVLSPDWFDYVMSVLRHNKVKQLYSRIAGWTLEAPILRQSPSGSVASLYRLASQKSSVFVSELKRVRSFIIIPRVWRAFLKWYEEESGNVPVGVLDKLFVSRMENRGIYTEWSREIWISWFSYFLLQNMPSINQLGYIVTSSGGLCVRLQVSFLKRWDEKKESCYSAGELINDVGIRSVYRVRKHASSVLVPDEIPVFRMGPKQQLRV